MDWMKNPTPQDMINERLYGIEQKLDLVLGILLKRMPPECNATTWMQVNSKLSHRARRVIEQLGHLELSETAKLILDDVLLLKNSGIATAKEIDRILKSQGFNTGWFPK